MDTEHIERCFLNASGAYAFARWGRAIAPVIFGVEESALPILKGAIEAVANLAGIGVTDVDPELGTNMMVFFFRDWDELTQTPDLDRLVPDLGPLVARLQAENASQYRFFRFDDAGAIQAAFLFVRMQGTMADLPAETLALTQAVQAILTWGPGAFSETSPLALHPDNGAVVLRPEIGDLIRAAYDPVMPASARDSAHALRLAARLS